MAAFAATTNAENEEEEDASPAEIGKLHSLIILANFRFLPITRSKHWLTRNKLGSSITPFIIYSS
jgi:hypothetical protein